MMLWLGFLPSMVTAQDMTEDASDLFEAFLSEHGEDLDGCFDELVEMRSGPEGPDLDSDKPPVPKRLLVAVDASGSMAGRVGGVSKMEAAKSAVDRFLGTLPDTIDVGLVAFGHTGNNEESGKALSCEGVEVLAPAGSVPGMISTQIDGLTATGWTPLADAIVAAGTELQTSDIEGEQIVYVVSDGEETCGGDPVAAARALNQSDIKAVVNIIGLDLPAADRQALQAVASAGGGVFEGVSDAEQLFDALSVRARNIGEMTRVRAMSGHAIAANNSAVGGAMLRVNTCTAGIITRENRAFGEWQRAQRAAETAPEIIDAVSDMKTERHNASRDRARELYEDLSTANDGANATIRDAADAAEEEFDLLEKETDK